MQDFMAWPTDVIASIAVWDSDASGNLVEVMRRGLIVNSDYSGMDCPREALTHCSAALARYYSMNEDEFRITFSRCSDKGQPQKKTFSNASR